MRTLVCIAAMIFGTLSFAQGNKEIKLEDKGDTTTATYFYDNGTVEQEGTFNREGNLHGVWTSYDTEGNKVAVGKYNNGKKVGKWFFWVDNALMEVDYKNSRIASVNKWEGSTKLAIRD